MYTVYKGIPSMWTDPDTVTDHPALTAIYGVLPPSLAVDIDIVAATADLVVRTWNFTDCWGWDFPWSVRENIISVTACVR